MKTVCVIGLGPAGITAVKELKEQGFDVTGYDAGKKIGGRWAMDWEVSEHGAWKELHMNNSRHISEFSDFPWKKEDFSTKPGVEKDRHGYYPHSTETYHYLKAYADHFDLTNSMKLNTRIIKIERSGNDWIVHTEGEDKFPKKDTFNGLVMCQGRYNKVVNPLASNGGPLVKFSGDIIHSANFKSIDMAKNKRVLVVGSSVSGCDVTGSISRNGEAILVDHSMRRVPYMLNHLTKKGEITDEKFFTRLIIWLTTYLPESISNKGFQSSIMEDFPLQVTDNLSKDFIPHDDIAVSGVSYAYDWVETLKKGMFTLRHGIQSSEGKTVTFTDGTSGEYDLVICGTGYSMDLSILPQDVVEKVKFTNPWSQQEELALYKWSLVPNMPTIAFCGAQHAIGPAFPCCEMNARWVANVFADYAGRTSLASRPTEAAIEKAVNNHKLFREASPGHKYDMAITAIELMASEMGLAPGKLWSLWNASKLLFQYPYACYYRTDVNKNDPKTAAKAQERFDFLVNNVPVDLK